jgi:tRNA U38,U39,U40 pseudouridine synthase TruA
VGTLYAVGRGKLPVESIPRLVAARDRQLSPNTAPPHGLYLMDVEYPPDDAHVWLDCSVFPPVKRFIESKQ